MAGSGMYAYYNPNSPSSSWAMNAPTVRKAEQKALDAKAEAEAKKKAEAEAKEKAEAEAKEKAKAEPAPDPVATLPEATFSLPVGSPEGADEGSGEGGAPEPEPAQPTGPVSLAGGLAVGSGAPNVDMGKLAESRGGLPYSFEETEQDPVTVKFPMTQDQFDALSTRQQMQAEQKLNQTGVDLSKMLLPTQADVNLYQSREGKLLEGGAPEPTFEIEADPRNYVDSRRPNEGRWIDPQTGDQYNVTEAYGRLLRQRMPQLVRPEVMDRMMGMGMAPEFMGGKSSRVKVETGDPTSPDEGYEGLEGPELDAARELLQKQEDPFEPKKGVKREEGLAQLDEEAKEADRIRRGAPKERTVGDNIVVSETDEEVRRREAAFENDRRQQEQEFLAAPLPDVSDTVQQELARRSAVEELPDAMDVSSDLNRPEAQVTAPEVDIPMDDDGEPDEGFNVEMDPDDVSSFIDAVEANFAQPRVTPELSDADLGPFIEAIFGEGTEATDEIVAQVREILSDESYRGMTPAQVRAEVRRRSNEFIDPLQ